jgi:hypothetical protein
LIAGRIATGRLAQTTFLQQSAPSMLGDLAASTGAHLFYLGATDPKGEGRV